MGGSKVKKNEWQKRLTFVVILSLTAAGFVVWMMGLLAVWGLLRLVGVSAPFLAMAEALSTALAAAGLLGAGFVAYRELDEVASSRHMEVADRLFAELNSPENVKARRWVFQHLPDDPEQGLAALDETGQDAVKKVLNSLDHVAFLTQTHWIPEEMIMPWMNPMVVKAWIRLKPYVEYESQRRQEPDYYQDVRELAEHCLEWRAKTYQTAQITWVDNAL